MAVKTLGEIKAAFPPGLIVSSASCCRVFQLCVNQGCEVKAFYNAYTDASSREEVLDAIMLAVENDWMTLKNAASLCRAFGIYEPSLLYLTDEDTGYLPPIRQGSNPCTASQTL